MIDFHCHLDLYNNALSLLPIVSARNIFTLVNTTSPRAWQKTSTMFSKYKNIQVALGLHPEIVDKKLNEQELLLTSIPKAEFIGEIGIDGSYRYKATISIQKSLFNEILIETEKYKGKIMSIHSRNAASSVLDSIELYCTRSIPVLHWFSGSVNEVRRAVLLGCWFSIGPAMINKGIDIILNEIPRNRIIPETDGPFAISNNLPLMPWESMNIADYIAPLWNISKDSFYDQMKNNLKSLISKNCLCNDVHL